jgi:MoxR-like ATPase
MNRANKAVLNFIMQFVQKGKVSEYQLPDKWVIVAAGNRPEEAEGVADFDFALAGRFTIKFQWIQR